MNYVCFFDLLIFKIQVLKSNKVFLNKNLKHGLLNLIKQFKIIFFFTMRKSFIQLRQFNR